MRGDDDKLLATVAVELITAANHLLGGQADVPEYLIAKAVALAVIDLLEMVYVHHDQ
jgi:hypothetical protein